MESLVFVDSMWGYEHLMAIAFSSGTSVEYCIVVFNDSLISTIKVSFHLNFEPHS